MEETTRDDPAAERDSAGADVERAADAAAAEAGEIGGRRPPGRGEAGEPVEQAGGGVAEGFEEAEETLVERAEHREPGGNPKYDTPAPEAEKDPAVHGDADEALGTEDAESTDTAPRPANAGES